MKADYFFRIIDLYSPEDYMINLAPAVSEKIAQLLNMVGLLLQHFVQNFLQSQRYIIRLCLVKFR